MKTIPLSRGQVAVVDDEDYASVARFKWWALKSDTRFYAVRRKPGTGKKVVLVLMHRAITNTRSKNIFVDHVNGDSLDNRRVNLRRCKRQQNCRNQRLRTDSKTGLKGVSKKGSAWVARIQVAPRTRLYLGRFKTAQDAARAYDTAALKYFGEFARTNGGAQ